jgi:hypothetical protein
MDAVRARLIAMSSVIRVIVSAKANCIRLVQVSMGIDSLSAYCSQYGKEVQPLSIRTMSAA